MSTDAQKRASINYNRKQDNIMIRPSKKEGAAIRAAAAAAGQSVQGYVLDSVRWRMERDQVEQRFAEIDVLPAVKPTPEEIAAFDEAAADDPAEVLTLDEYKHDTHRTARMMIEASIERGEAVSTIPDWYIEEVASDNAKRERLLAYALDHADEDTSFRKVIRLFKGMV